MNLDKYLMPYEVDFLPKNIVAYNDGYWAVLVPYKTARIDMDILDECVGKYNWQNKYRRDSAGVLQCGIGICDDKGRWIWKWSNGTPSQFEKEKGEYSDAFKRAGFMWGIGRCLYNFPKIRVALNEKEVNLKGDVPKISNSFRPNDWKWEFYEGYAKIVGTQKIGNSPTVRCDSAPYKKTLELLTENSITQ